MKLTSIARLCGVGFALVMVCGVLLRPLTPVDETRYVAVAWEMWLSGDYLVPTKNFDLYTHKPPLLFWLINVVWLFTGVSEIAARLVGPAFALLGVVLTGRLARRLWPDDPEVGARAVIALTGTLVFTLAGGLTMFDAMLSATVLAGVLALLQAARSGLWRWWAAVGAAIALGTLAKGPVILMHLLPVMLFSPIWARGMAPLSWRRMVLGTGLAIATALGLVGLWLVPAIISGGEEYRTAVLWTQSAGRVTQSFSHARPWWFFLALLPLLLFPWLFMPALWRAARRIPTDPGLKLAAIWAGAGFVLFSLISGKQIHYLIPELPAIALIVARLAGAATIRVTWATLPVLLAATLALLAASGVIDLPEDAARMLHPTTVLLAWSFFLIAICWFAFQAGGLTGGAVLTLGLALSLNLLIGLTDSAKFFDTHRIAEIIVPYEDRGIAYFGQTYNAEFNFAGRLTSPVATPPDAQALAAWAERHPDGVIVARIDRPTPPWPPRQTIAFRNSTYGIWHVADAPAPEPQS